MYKDIRKQRKYQRLYHRAYRAKKKAQEQEITEFNANGWSLK